MDSIIAKMKLFPIIKRPSLFTGVAILAGAACYVAWNFKTGRYSRIDWIKGFLIYARVRGAKSKFVAASYTELYYFHLLTYIGKLLPENERCKRLEIVHDLLPGQENDLTADHDYQFVKLPLTTEFQYKGATFFLLMCTQTDEVDVGTFPWNRALLEELLQEAMDMQRGKKSDEVVYFFYLSSTLDWQQMAHRKKRPMDSVILNDGVKEGLIQDVRGFFANREWYLDKGIPYRRGYLLHGPPGTGKSSIIFSLAGEIGYDICFLSLSSPHLNDDALATAMSKVFVKTIVLIEDIDSAFDHKDSTDAPNKMADSCKVTFKGILNALDGVSSQEGRIVFITTNHIKKLDPALIRPGRVDVKICIDYATEDQIRKMFARFYPHVEPQVVKEMCLKIQKGLKKSRKKASMACLQSLFILHKDNPNDAVDHAEKHFEEYADSANTGYLDFYM